MFSNVAVSKIWTVGQVQPVKWCHLSWGCSCGKRKFRGGGLPLKSRECSLTGKAFRPWLYVIRHLWWLILPCCIARGGSRSVSDWGAEPKRIWCPCSNPTWIGRLGFWDFSQARGEKWSHSRPANYRRVAVQKLLNSKLPRLEQASFTIWKDSKHLSSQDRNKK